MQRHILQSTDSGGAKRQSRPAAAFPRRGGAVIILSLSLLMTLLFLGLFFFNFINDEFLSADIYAKQFQGDTGITGNAQILNHGLDQVIVGTNDSDRAQPHYAPFSVLYGGQYSLLAHILGRIGERDPTTGQGTDLDGDGIINPWMPLKVEPFAGSGARVYYNSTSMQYEVEIGDNDGDGNPDVVPLANFRLNGSPLAGGGMTLYDANVGFTYPDLNALFLYHELEYPTGGPKAIKPSFDVPGLLFEIDPNTGALTGSHYLARERVLRPHTGFQTPSGPRYLTAAVAPGGAQSGDTTRGLPALEPQYRVDVPTQLGIWTASGNNYSSLHVDANGDGVTDSWLLDLDYPLITFADGRQAVPLFFFRIEDLDALINLNSAGDIALLRAGERNLGWNRADVLTALTGMSGFTTGGNFGWSPSEINPGVALHCDPGDSTYVNGTNSPPATEQIAAYYAEQAGITGVNDVRSDVTHLQLANTELLWLQTGRHQYDSGGSLLPPSTYDVAGRYGETKLLNTGAVALPAAGTTGVDDDRDSNTGRRPGGGARYGERFYARNGAPTTAAVPMPPAIHPLDATGFGDWLEDRPGVGMRQLREWAPNLNASFANNPSRWPQYRLSLWQNQVGAAGGVSPYFTAAGGNVLQPAASLDMLLDEPDELILDDSDANFPNPDDQPFPASEITSLHASDSDWSSLARTSRLRQLAPVNFEINYRAAEIRRKFTVMSWDRPELAFPRDPRRPWEFNDNATSPEQRFPPRFAGATASRHENGVITGNDPIRPEVRRLLTIDFDGTTPNDLPQHPLLLNGILSDDSVAGGAPCFDNNGNPRFRPLVPHPVLTNGTDGAITPAAMIHSNSTAPPYAFSAIGNSKAAQEWWARYDRQRLARDIYTLLWVMGSPVDSVSTNPYTIANGYVDLDGDGVPDVIQEMAQFAVNVVDAMDHDNVITRFEYDADLSDGWQWNSGDPTSLVVHGVEAQALTLSEVLCIKSRQVTDAMGNPTDHPATLYDDATGDRFFLFIELRNALPFAVPIANDTYRLRILENSTDAELAKATFDGTLATATGNYQVGPGENYYIGTHSGDFQVVGGPDAGKNQAAIFWLDHQVDGGSTPANLDYYQQVPYLSSALRPQGADLATARQVYPNPLCNLDLCHDRDRAGANPRFVEASSGVGYFLAPLVAGTVTSFQLVLERRQSMQGDGLIADASNDWVEIDRMTVEVDEFALDQTSDHNVTRSQLANLVSQERREPFFAENDPRRSIDYAGGNTVLRHTLGGVGIDDTGNEPFSTTPMGLPIAAPNNSLRHQRNSRLPQFEGNYQFQITQLHFDRGFTSIYDLLSVPTIGPSQLVYRQSTPAVYGGLVEAGQTRMTGVNTAGMRFAYPQPAAALPTHLSSIASLTTRHYENRWYRLFGVLALPSRTSDEIADDMTLRRRIPGRVNLNTLRFEEVYGAVVNDADQLELLNPGAGVTVDSYTNSRNWYNELRRTRDGQDNGGNILPPGTPLARPFRPATYENPDFDPAETTRAIANNPVDDTLLRMGQGAFANIGLLEARAPGDVNNDVIDYYTRQRILSRVANLTTNRSHVYVIWAGFQLHEAHDLNSADPNNPRVQIGGRMPANEFPTYRELLVVDMSRLEEAYDPANQSFNFASFIVHREVLP